MDLSIFQYITSVDGLDEVWLLAYLCNLVLTVIYIVLFYISYIVVVRCLRKGALN